MKKLKLTLLLLLTLSTFALLCSCKKQKEEPFSAEMITTNAKHFLNALCEEDYQLAIDLAFFPNSSFFIASDIEGYIMESSYKDIPTLNKSVKKIEISEDIDTEGSNKIALGTLYDENDKKLMEYNIVFVENENNEWRIDISEFYVTDWQLKTSGGNSILYIDGNEAKDISYSTISDSYGGGKETYKQYKFGAIGKVSKSFSIKSDTFEETSMSLTPGTDNDTLLRAEVSKEDSLKIFEDIMSSWNGLYDLFLAGNDYNAAYEYVSSDVDVSVIEKIWQNFSALSEKGTDFEISSVSSREDSSCFYYTDTLVGANFTYNLNWSAGSMKDNTSIIMRLEDDKYKICIIPYEKFFYYASPE